MASTSTVADDAVQETFLRAWRYFDSFRGDGSFQGWLIRICRRCIIDLEARHRRTDALELDSLRLAVPADHRSETMALIGGLPSGQREVLVVCGILGYSYDSAADILDLPVGTVRSRLHRARAALAAAMAASPGERASA